MLRVHGYWSNEHANNGLGHFSKHLACASGSPATLALLIYFLFLLLLIVIVHDGSGAHVQREPVPPLPIGGVLLAVRGGRRLHVLQVLDVSVGVGLAVGGGVPVRPRGRHPPRHARVAPAVDGAGAGLRLRAASGQCRRGRHWPARGPGRAPA
ncbi:hypothetical protein VPH35_085680 [Triticum aestivum]|uniref:Uncharacterized protein n=1 Tax=Triticum urartu TaxID=4572 RepID=A0A8R7ULY5_TRIUA